MKAGQTMSVVVNPLNRVHLEAEPEVEGPAPSATMSNEAIEAARRVTAHRIHDYCVEILRYVKPAMLIAGKLANTSLKPDERVDGGFGPARENVSLGVLDKLESARYELLAACALTNAAPLPGSQNIHDMAVRLAAFDGFSAASPWPLPLPLSRCHDIEDYCCCALQFVKGIVEPHRRDARRRLENSVVAYRPAQIADMLTDELGFKVTRQAVATARSRGKFEVHADTVRLGDVIKALSRSIPEA